MRTRDPGFGDFFWLLLNARMAATASARVNDRYAHTSYTTPLRGSRMVMRSVGSSMGLACRLRREVA